MAQPGLTLTFIGKPGVGKSSVINELAKMSKVAVSVDRGISSTPVITTVPVAIKFYCEERRQVITVVDTPGICPEYPAKSLLQAVNRLGSTDVYVLCLSYSRVHDIRDLTSHLTETYGLTFWKQVVVVFTFGNALPCSSSSHEEHRNIVTAEVMKEVCTLTMIGSHDVPFVFLDIADKNPEPFAQLYKSVDRVLTTKLEKHKRQPFFCSQF